MAVDFEDRDDEGVGDVALEEPGFFILAAVEIVVVAKSRGRLMSRVTSRTGVGVIIGRIVGSLTQRPPCPRVELE